MARLVQKQAAETVYTLELTEREVATITAALGVTSVTDRERSELAKRFNLIGNDFPLYRFLRDDVLGVFS
jgi:hypothetical protein